MASTLVTIYLLWFLGAPRQVHPFLVKVYPSEAQCEHFRGVLQQKLSVNNKDVKIFCSVAQTTSDLIHFTEDEI